MKKTLALLLAAVCLYFAPFAPLSIKSQPLVTATKFYTVANPVPNRYIVVLATTDLSPIPAPAPTPVGSKSAKTSTSTMSAPSSPSASDADSSTMAFEVEGPIPADTEVEATATALTADYGGTFNLTWSSALKGFRLNAT